jgi:hypothetical protein
VRTIQDLNLKLEDLATTTPEIDEGSFPSRFFASLFARLTHWFADAQNGITDFFAKRVHTQEICTTRSDGSEVCASGDQLAAILAGTSAGAPTGSGGGGAPASLFAPRESGADTATTTTPVDGATDTDTHEDDSAADASSSGVAPAAPAASSTSEGTNANAVFSTMSDVTGAATSNAPAANDNQSTEDLPATGTE